MSASIGMHRSLILTSMHISSQCHAKCQESGFRTRAIECVWQASKKSADESMCQTLKRPVDTERCFNSSCWELYIGTCLSNPLLSIVHHDRYWADLLLLFSFVRITYLRCRLHTYCSIMPDCYYCTLNGQFYINTKSYITRHDHSIQGSDAKIDCNEF